MAQEYSYKRQKLADTQGSGIPLATLDNNLPHIPSASSMGVFKKKSASNRLSVISNNRRQSIIGPPRLTTFGPPSSASKRSLQQNHNHGAELAEPGFASGRVSSINGGLRNSIRKAISARNGKSSRISVYSKNDIGSANGANSNGGVIPANNINNNNNSNSNNINNNNNNNNNTGTIHGIGALPLQKDPRPLRDRAYQEEMRQDIYNYLTENNFEMETKHLLTEKTLKSPTQKDFVIIFNWLFKQIDPGHRPTRTIESDVTTLLKIVQYPYLDTINKSQISAVGGHNWHVFLGMLHWLVKCSYFNQETADEVDSEELANSGIEEFDPGEKLNNMFLKYIKNAYQLFLMDKDNYEPLKEDLQVEFNKFMKIIEGSVGEVEGEYQDLLKQYKKLVHDDEIIENGNKRSQALETDILKFKEYIRSIEARKIKWNANINKMNGEVENLTLQKLELEKDNAAIIKQLTDNGLNLSDVRNLIDDRSNVIREYEETKKQVDEMTIKEREHEQEARRQLDGLQALIKDFNLDAYNVSNVAGLEFNFELDVEIQLDNVLDESKLGLRPEELLNGQDLRTTKRVQLKEFNKLMRDKLFKDKDEIIKYQNSIDLLNEKLVEKKEYYNNLEAKLSLAKISSDELYNTMTLEANASNTEMEKLESQLQAIKTSLDLSLLEIDQKIHSTEIEFDRVLNEVKQKREQLHREVEKIINNVISFKMDIQESLEELEQTVLAEHREANESR